jgi:hypothetical protein
VCQGVAVPGDLFCGNCGSALTPAPAGGKFEKGAARQQLLAWLLLAAVILLWLGVKYVLDHQGFRAPWTKPAPRPAR